MPAPSHSAGIPYRTNCLSRTTLVRVACCVALFAAGCGTVKPEGDYRNAAALITKHTGAKEVYDPLVDPLIAKKVEDLLQDGLHLDAAIQVALLNNRTFQSLFLDIGVSRAEVVQSGMLTNPSFSLLPRIPDIGGRINLTVGFAQELADLWQMPVRKKTALDQLEKTVLKVADAAITLAAQVKTQYFQLVALRESERIGRENVELVGKSLMLAQHRFDAGETTLLDVNLVRSDTVASRMRLSKVQGDIEEAHASFAKLLGIDTAKTAWELADPLGGPKGDIADNAALIALAASQRLDAQIGAMGVRLAEKELAKVGRSLIPSLTLGAETERTENKAGPSRAARGFAAWDPLKDPLPAFPTVREDKLADKQVVNFLTGPSFQATLPVWDQNRAQLAKARMQVLQKRKDQQELEETIREDVEKAAVRVRKAAELLRVNEQEALPLAEHNYETAQRVYQAGEDSILVVMEAHKSLVGVRDARNQALGDYAVATAELERAVGGRLDAGTGGNP